MASVRQVLGTFGNRNKFQKGACFGIESDEKLIQIHGKVELALQ
jgi:hypothetical protein